MDTCKATNTANGRFYIGSTLNFERRKLEHLNSKKNLPFQNALRKNPEAFEWEVWSDESSEPVLEQALLDVWFGKECCYNLNPVAGRPPSFEGRTHTKEVRERLSVANTGKKHSPETRMKIKESVSQRKLPDALIEMQKKPKRGKEHPRSRPILLVNLDTGLTEVFDCVLDAAKKYNLSDGHLCATAKGKRRQHKGYRAEYI